MIAVSVFGISEGTVGLGEADLIRGALAGAFIVAMAFLAGYAAIRRSGLAVCALVMVAAAAALELSWLGFFSGLSSEGVVMLQALFAAGAIVFLSASVGAARYNALLGGVMFTAALVLGGMGVINFFDRIDLAPLMRMALIGVGGFAVILAALQSLRGDNGARLVLPGVALAAAAPVLGLFGGESAAVAVASHGLFTLGVISASIVALTESGAPALSGVVTSESLGFHSNQNFEGRAQHSATTERAEIVLDSQIARVLDYSGVGIWDWSPQSVDQTPSLPSLLGADSSAPFTPDALRNFIHADDAARFDSEVLSPLDGPFDSSLKLFDGRLIRIRGARAANEESGQLERLVAFVEPVVSGASSNGVNETSLRSATEAAIVPSASGHMTAKLSAALEKGDIVAAFQPIVTLDNEKVAGYEALARWRDQQDGADEGPELFVKAAERAGQGGALANTMLQQAAAFLSDALQKEKRKDLFVAMNVSWGQIREDGFLEAVRDVVSKYDLPKHSLVLELTEADAISDVKLAANVFKKLKNTGVALAFDDFGSGFTCLSNLRKYNFDFLKIDKSFTGDLDSGGDGAKIVNALVSLGKDLGLKVIVEGVESKHAAQKAKQMGCAYGQGFQFGKPVMTETPEIKSEKVSETQSLSPKAPEDVAVADKLKLLAASPLDREAQPQTGETAVDVQEPAPAEDSAEFSETEKPFERKIEVDFSGGGENDVLDRKHNRWRLFGGESQ
ncbi:EAL domain-containing protein [Hyphococcus flavus]|uniref:EAL domain-containing protein n=1 Tax=Hyphococcus flavus TaxID=1866326 RepID=A0AAE9ZD74_9PROT|nr:GGDEF domain-containing phosphodiesterase [Hyphococcus flavus]WDI31415.1 EAL domain-containing protein [Hyphococcus flavus]